jgi:hypothetical protein
MEIGCSRRLFADDQLATSSRFDCIYRTMNARRFGRDSNKRSLGHQVLASNARVQFQRVASTNNHQEQIERVDYCCYYRRHKRRPLL